MVLHPCWNVIFEGKKLAATSFFFGSHSEPVSRVSSREIPHRFIPEIPMNQKPIPGGKQKSLQKIHDQQSKNLSKTILNHP